MTSQQSSQAGQPSPNGQSARTGNAPRTGLATRIGRIALGGAVGASFGIVIGALVASWIWGVQAIESEAVASSYLTGVLTLVGAVIGGLVGFRTGRSAGSEVVVEQNRSAEQSRHQEL